MGFNSRQSKLFQKQSLSFRRNGNSFKFKARKIQIQRLHSKRRAVLFFNSEQKSVGIKCFFLRHRKSAQSHFCLPRSKRKRILYRSMENRLQSPEILEIYKAFHPLKKNHAKLFFTEIFSNCTKLQILL